MAGWINARAAADSKDLAETKRDLFFPGQLIAKMWPSEVARVLGVGDQCCRYTEFPIPILINVDWGEQRTTHNGKRVTDATTLLRLI